MTETQRNTLRIPSREEFHRYTSNLLTEWDFCTDFPPALAHGQADSPNEYRVDVGLVSMFQIIAEQH